MVMLLPRYRSCVDEVGGVLGLHRITESALVRGLKAMKQWVVDTANLGRGAFRAGTARLFRNGVAIGTDMTNAVTNSTLLTPCFAMFSRTTATRLLACDFISIRAQRA